VSRERSAPPAARPPLERRGDAAETPAAGGDGTTSGGLTRRVRGAQLPTTEPVRMRRSPEPTPAAAPARAPARTPEQRRKADDVYSFLSSFTAGVRRGLDDSAPDGQGDVPPA
jgi:hypothetical protein